MANDLNQCQFIGRLGRDPEMRYTAAGEAVCNFSIAVGESWKDRESGDKKESTEWVRCVAWKKLAEICGEYMKKGSQVYVSGKMKTRKWTDKDGQDKYTTEIVIDTMQMLGGRQERGDAPAERQAAPAGAQKPAGKFEDMEDDIPFTSCELGQDVIFKNLRWPAE